MAARFDAKPDIQPLFTDSPRQNTFLAELTEAFLAVGIPWSKIDNPKLKNFLERHTKKSIPDSSTMRKCYLKRIYSQSIESIRKEIADFPVWISVDETTDAMGRFIANVLVGSMQIDKATKGHLLMCRQLEHTNNATITQLILDAFPLLWPGVSQADISKKFLLFLTDGVPYMIKAGKNLQKTYPDLIHITCLAHGINRVAEEVRNNFPEVDKIIGAVKAVFRKAPSRILKFRSMCPDLPLPPRPVITRWGTWLEAAEYYSQHYMQVKSVLDSFDNDDAKCIETAKSVFEKIEIRRDLCYISSNFTFLRITLKQLQETFEPISSVLKLVENTLEKLRQARGTAAEKVLKKMEFILEKNCRLKDIQTISDILDGQSNMTPSAIDKFEVSRISSFMYAPLTSVSPERSFSMLKALFSDNRRSITVENMEMDLISHFELTI